MLIRKMSNREAKMTPPLIQHSIPLNPSQETLTSELQFAKSYHHMNSPLSQPQLTRHHTHLRPTPWRQMFPVRSSCSSYSNHPRDLLRVRRKEMASVSLSENARKDGKLEVVGCPLTLLLYQNRSDTKQTQFLAHLQPAVSHKYREGAQVPGRWQA